MNMKIHYLRFERESTDSWITIRLEEPIEVNELTTAEELGIELGPGWELITGWNEAVTMQENQAIERAMRYAEQKGGNIKTKIWWTAHSEWYKDWMPPTR
jgi:hypothetical protein